MTSAAVATAARSAILDEILADVIAPNAATVDRESAFPEDGLRVLGEAGFLRLSVPEAWDGGGATAVELSDVVSRIARVCASTAMVYLMHLTALTSVLRFATPEQRARYLEPIVRDGALITEAISEPGSGSQWWTVSSTADRTSNGYRIDADKSFATAAGHADFYVVSTRAPGSSDDRDHALFVVAADHGGITAGEWRGLGLAGNSSTWMGFHCDVERDALLFGGGDRSGLRRYNEANQPLNHLLVASAYLGIAEAAFDACVERVRTRKYPAGASALGSGLSKYPIAQRHVGSMKIRLVAGASLVHTLATAIDAGVPFEQIAIMMTATKVALAESAVSVARRAMMASGGSAYTRGPLPIERHLRDALAGSLMGPNDDFCKELIGRLEVDRTSYHDL